MYDFEKEIDPRGYSDPGLYDNNSQTNYWCISRWTFVFFFFLLCTESIKF